MRRRAGRGVAAGGRLGAGAAGAARATWRASTARPAMTPSAYATAKLGLAARPHASPRCWPRSMRPLAVTRCSARLSGLPRRRRGAGRLRRSLDACDACGAAVLLVVCLVVLAPPARSSTAGSAGADRRGQRLRRRHRRATIAQAIADLSRAAAAGHRRRARRRDREDVQPWPDIQSYAVKMFENGGRGIGTQEGKDNGILVLLAVDDRRVRIEVGYGLEAFITDGFAGEVSRETMVPYLQARRLRRRPAGRGRSRSRTARRGARDNAARLDDVARHARQRGGGGFPWWPDRPSAVSDLHQPLRGRRRRMGAAPGAGGRAASGRSARASAAASGIRRRIVRRRVRRRVRRLRRRPERRRWRRRVMVGSHVRAGRQSCPSAIRKEDRCAAQ